MPVSPGESIFAHLEPHLPGVSKPIQYVGGELNSVSKDWGEDAETVRWALMYPDAYEVGLPNQGVQILYEVLNEGEGTLAERTYAVWPDMEAVMREHGLPQFTVDATGRCATSTCSGSPSPPSSATPTCSPRSTSPASRCTPTDRTHEDPIVLAGGHAAFNPEPIADFIDAAVLGDGEEVVLAITEVVREWKREGRPGGRDEVLLRLAASGGVYVPRFYDVDLPRRRRARAVDAQPARRTRTGCASTR